MKTILSLPDNQYQNYKQMSKILITGIAGMIGSVLADYFVARGYEVIGVDDLSGGFIENINEKVKFCKFSILDRDSLENIFVRERPNYVIHTACFAAECLSPFIRNFLSQNIVVGTENIINCCVNYNVKKIINFTSIARYGVGKPPFKETDLANPIDCYGIYKLTAEMSLKEAYNHFGLDYVSFAPHNVLSKSRQSLSDPYRNVASLFIRKCIEGNNLQIYGDGRQTRSFSDAKFICEPVENAMGSKLYPNYLFNIGSDKSYSIRELAGIVIAEGVRRGYDKSKIEYLEPRIEVKHATSDHSLVKNILGFRDETDLVRLIMDMFTSAESQIPFKPYKNMNYEITKNMYSFWK